MDLINYTQVFNQSLLDARDYHHKHMIKSSKQIQHDLNYKVAKAERKLNDRSYLKSKLNNSPILALGTRTRNWVSGTGFKGDVRANKLARLQNKVNRQNARQDYHNRIMDLDHNNPRYNKKSEE